MKYVLALAAGAALSAAVVAEPLGTNLDVTVSHTGPFGEVQNFVHTYGGSNQVFDSFGFSYLVVSAAQVAGYDNAISFDFTNFAYTDFAGESGSINITGFAQNVTSAAFLNGSFTTIPAATTNGTSISGNWAVDDVLAAGNVLYVAWNKVPAPGATAVFGLAGLAGLRRRR